MSGYVPDFSNGDESLISRCKIILSVQAKGTDNSLPPLPFMEGIENIYISQKNKSSLYSLDQ